MKKNFTLIALVFAVCSLQAQLNLSDLPSAGDSEYYRGLDTTGIQEGPGGTGLTWDYSGATTSGTNLIINWVTPSSHPQGSNFPGATVAMSLSTGDYVFYRADADSIVNIGEQSVTGQPCSYPNTQGTLIRFPGNVSDIVVDSLYGVYFDGFLTNVTRWGQVTTEVDGSGTLMTPNITWNNVTRVYYQYVYRDSSWTGAAISDIYVFRFEWYAAGRPTPVFITNTRLVSVNQGPFTEERRIWYADTTAVGINDGLQARGLEVFPNPTEGLARISYELDAAQEVNVSLYNLMGEQVMEVYSGMQESGVRTLNLDASLLSAGVYVVRLKAGDAVVNRKLVIN